MDERRWVSAVEIRHRLGDISKSSLIRRTRDLDLIRRGFVIKLGRRALYSLELVRYLPILLKQGNSNTTKEQETKNAL